MRYVVVFAVIFSGLATGQELPQNADEVKSLTTLTSYELAEELASSANLSKLNSVKTLSAVAASAFEGYQGHLSLNGLTSISPGVATSLALVKGRLSLDGVTTLTDATALSLAGYQGETLTLRGLTELSDHAAAALRCNGRIILPAKFVPPPTVKPGRKERRAARYDVPVRTLIRPKDGVRHPDLDKAWTAYEEVATKWKNAIHAAITKQFDAAAAKGDLDAAEKWQKALEAFEKSGEFPIESDPKGTVRKPLTMDDSATVAECREANDELGHANDELAKAYESVVKALTMEKKLVEAKAVRDEGSALGNAKEVLSPQEPGTGLMGEYFRQNNFEGRSFRKIDSVFDRDYVRNPVGDGFPTQNFSIRWTGTIVPDRTDEYTFCGYCDDGLTILIDGKPVYENMGWAANFASNPVRLEAGKSHKVVFAYVDWGKGNAKLTLKWHGKGKNPEPIPVQCLFPSAVRP